MTRINALVVIVGVILFFSCQKEQSENKPIPELRIGVIYPFSGSNKSTGDDLRAGLELAVEIINETYELPIPLAKEKGLPGLGNVPIRLVYKDSQVDEKIAPELVQELVTKENVSAIIGCYHSAVTSTASEAAEIMKIPFLNPDSTSPLLTQRGLKWFFRTTSDDMMFSENFFMFLSDISTTYQINFPKRIVLLYENRLWGTSVARAERKLAMKYGYEIVDDIPYAADARSFENELERIKQAMPAIIMQSSYATDAIALMKGFKDKQINPIAILAMNAGFISPSFLQELKTDGEFVFSREVWALDLGKKKELIYTVNHMFHKKYQRNMTGNSSRAFTGLIVLADAIHRAGTIEPEKIRQALLKTNLKSDQLIMPWDGVLFDPDTGQNILGKGIVVQIINGEYRTVWPLEMSQSAIVFPMPAWSERRY